MCDMSTNNDSNFNTYDERRWRNRNPHTSRTGLYYTRIYIYLTQSIFLLLIIFILIIYRITKVITFIDLTIMIKYLNIIDLIMIEHINMIIYNVFLNSVSFCFFIIFLITS